jgi:hypothetical protein
MKKCWKIRITGIFFLCLLTFGAKAQLPQYYASYIYQFSRYVDWPAVNGDFIIVVIGKSAITDPLKQITKDKKVGNSKIVIQICTPDNITECHILFVPESQNSNFQSIKAKVDNKNVLLVTESESYIKNGAGICFHNDEGKLKFDINKSAIKRNGLDVAIELERYASKIY